MNAATLARGSLVETERHVRSSTITPVVSVTQACKEMLLSAALRLAAYEMMTAVTVRSATMPASDVFLFAMLTPVHMEHGVKHVIMRRTATAIRLSMVMATSPVKRVSLGFR